MRTSTRAALLVAAAAAGTVATTRAVSARRRPATDGIGRSHALTVERPYDELTSLDLPAPLVDLGDAVTVELRDAPGDRGTEIHVRRVGDRVSAGDVRKALREARSLLEVGYVLLPDAPPTTKKTLRNKPLRAATEHGREGGLL
ncbi:hypothetical protein [Actinoplanes sp. RD1]|uniref:hypothetical protein n=1 Tax=Actinoplanes sp. RD1 TaxID=3064538 RepID=UPI0027424E92|nr:hypothetical protein [Actinoplanes sp. RD1]